jgi:hypothetical protein
MPKFDRADSLSAATPEGICYLRKEVDLRTLALTPYEAYVLSRMEGRATLDDLIAVTGLPRSEIEGVLCRLIAHGAIAIVDPQPQARAVSGRRPIMRSTRASNDEDERPSQRPTTPATSDPALAYDWQLDGRRRR